LVLALSLVAVLTACGGGGGGSPPPITALPPPTTPPPAPPPPPPSFDAQYVASGTSPFAADCEGVAQTGTNYTNAEVEPYLAINPLNGNQMVGLWQQDRWSNGSARGLMTGVSNDGGKTWSRQPTAFSRCGGGNAANGGDYMRATDPWVSFGKDGVVHKMGLATTGTNFQAGSVNAMLASRSTDGGVTWSPAATLIQDGPGFFNDKNAITADPTDARYVYAVWDRLVSTGGGPTILARSSDGGISWEPARVIHDPGTTSQTIGNVVAVLPTGDLVNVFNRIDTGSGGTNTSTAMVIRSQDKGTTWSQPIKVADMLGIGVKDPENGTPIRNGSLLPQIAVSPGGSLFVVWADARFSGGIRDGIAISRSNDGGLTWSAPVQVNGSPGVPAFMPTVHVRLDGKIGVTYFDLRSNTDSAATLLTDYWLARSDNGTTWVENRVSGPFDLSTAPLASGLFLGDYMGLGSVGNVFIPFFVQTTGSLANRTDVISAPQTSATASASASTAMVVAASAQVVAPTQGRAGFVPSTEFRRRTHEHIVDTVEHRVPGWRAMVERQRTNRPR